MGLVTIIFLIATLVAGVSIGGLILYQKEVVLTETVSVEDSIQTVVERSGESDSITLNGSVDPELILPITDILEEQLKIAGSSGRP